MLQAISASTCLWCARKLLTPKYIRPQYRSFVTCDLRRFRLAIIGSGPAGFYAAKKVLSDNEQATVDLYERLPVPYGLVRFGVAPDHPEVKNCQETFQNVASSPRFNFIGNVPIGDGLGSIPLDLIVPHYDAILLAYGTSQDRKLGISGEDQIKDVYPARAFVGWYNGLPDYAHLAPDLTFGEEAVVIGQGNVALDIARILLQNPDQLASSDITEDALETLRQSRIKRVRVVGRRGPIQAAFTIKEIRELTKISSINFEPIPDSLLPDDSIIQTLPRAPGRIMKLFKNTSLLPANLSSAASKSISLDFCLSPRALNIDPRSPSRLASITFEKTSLIPSPFDLHAKSIGTGEQVEIPCSTAFISIGYKSDLPHNFKKIGLPFDDRLGIIPNDGFGRIEIRDCENTHLRFYCAGWVKNGPTGNIATTMYDAFTTAESITSDWTATSQTLCINDSPSKNGWDAVKLVAASQGCRPVSWQDWQKIDMAERKNGLRRGKEREKFTRVDEMLAVLD